MSMCRCRQACDVAASHSFVGGTTDFNRERQVEQALVDHIQRFMLELGSGFAFVGRLAVDSV